MISNLISFDPTTIEITRHTKVQNFGGSDWAEETLDPITVRLYTPRQREWSEKEGEIKESSLGLLAEHGTDLRTGHDCYDTFDLADDSSPPEIRTYRIVSVRVYGDVNIPMCVQADCEAV